MTLCVRENTPCVRFLIELAQVFPVFVYALQRAQAGRRRRRCCAVLCCAERSAAPHSTATRSLCSKTLARVVLERCQLADKNKAQYRAHKCASQFDFDARPIVRTGRRVSGHTVRRCNWERSLTTGQNCIILPAQIPKLAREPYGARATFSLGSDAKWRLLTRARPAVEFTFRPPPRTPAAARVRCEQVHGARYNPPRTLLAFIGPANYARPAAIH